MRPNPINTIDRLYSIVLLKSSSYHDEQECMDSLMVGHCKEVVFILGLGRLRTLLPQAPSNWRMLRPALGSVRYMSPFRSTQQSQDWITCGRFGRGSNMRVGLAGT